MHIRSFKAMIKLIFAQIAFNNFSIFIFYRCNYIISIWNQIAGNRFFIVFVSLYLSYFDPLIICQLSTSLGEPATKLIITYNGQTLFVPVKPIILSMNQSTFRYLFANNVDIHIIWHRGKHTNNPHRNTYSRKSCFGWRQKKYSQRYYA